MHVALSMAFPPTPTAMIDQNENEFAGASDDAVIAVLAAIDRLKNEAREAKSIQPVEIANH